MKTNFKGRPFAQQLSCYRRARGPGFESRSGYDFFPLLWHLVAQCGFAARATSIKKCMSHCSSVVPSSIGDESIYEGELSKADHWLNNSLVSRIARGPGFDFRSAPPPPPPAFFSSPVARSKTVVYFTYCEASAISYCFHPFLVE